MKALREWLAGGSATPQREQPAPEQPTSLDSTSRYRDATEAIRSSARWLVTAFAGVGGVLVAGVPLTDLTAADSSSGHFWLAVACTIIALLTIGVMIMAVSMVFTSRYPTLSEFGYEDLETEQARWWRPWKRRRAELITKINGEVAGSWEELFGTRFRSIVDLQAALRIPAEPRSRGREVEEAQEVASSVLDYVNFEYARRVYRLTVRGSLFAGGTVVALAIVGFVFEVSQAPPEASAVTVPIPVRVYVNPANTGLKRTLCDAAVVDGIAVAGRLNKPEVVVPASDNCPAATFTVGSRQGIAVPQVKTPADLGVESP